MPLAADPAADKRDHLAASTGVPELDDKIWFHKTASSVIEAGRCIGCGGCIAACPSKSISVAADGKPTLTKMCTGCSACWDYCPMAGFRVERLQRIWGDEALPAGAPKSPSVHEDAYSARARADAGGQDGGFVTALLESLITSGRIDAAIVTRRENAFTGVTGYASTPEELRAAAGSVYHQTEPLSILNEKPPEGATRLAYVGTPCQVSVLRALQKFPWQWRDSQAPKVTLAIALFCTRSFEPTALMRAMLERGEDISTFERLDIREGKLCVRTKDGERRELGPVKDFRDASLRGCDECADFTGAAADLSVGNVGSQPGESTVLVRTPAGREAWEAGLSGGAYDAAPLEDLTAIEKLRAANERGARRSLKRDYDPEGPLWISYREHLETNEGTDRGPASVPAFRSHHYDVGC